VGDPSLMTGIYALSILAFFVGLAILVRKAPAS
jgi:hypothetical protein